MSSKVYNLKKKQKKSASLIKGTCAGKIFNWKLFFENLNEKREIRSNVLFNSTIPCKRSDLVAKSLLCVMESVQILIVLQSSKGTKLKSTTARD